MESLSLNSSIPDLSIPSDYSLQPRRLCSEEELALISLANEGTEVRQGDGLLC